MACHVRKNDQVVVITGDHKGARGKVLRVDPTKELVVIEGINFVYRHVRPSRKNPQGGRLQKEAPIHISNVLPIDPKTDRPTRVRTEVERGEEGQGVTKSRVAASGATLSRITRATKEQR